jgi:hypothetical protein
MMVSIAPKYNVPWLASRLTEAGCDVHLDENNWEFEAKSEGRTVVKGRKHRDADEWILRFQTAGNIDWSIGRTHTKESEEK